MQYQNDWVLATLTANRDPLVDAANFGEEGFVNALYGIDQSRLGELIVSIGSVGETATEQDDDKYRDAQQSELRYFPDLAPRAHRIPIRNGRREVPLTYNFCFGKSWRRRMIAAL